jgi:hypothetical protein
MPTIPDDVRRFVVSSIPSIPFLEAALLIRQWPARTWDEAHLGAALYVSARRGAELLEELRVAGIVTLEPGSSGGYRYGPRNEALTGAIAALAEVYPRCLIEITHLVHANSQSSAQRFADAFKLRKDR